VAVPENGSPWVRTGFGQWPFPADPSLPRQWRWIPPQAGDGLQCRWPPLMLGPFRPNRGQFRIRGSGHLRHPARAQPSMPDRDEVKRLLQNRLFKGKEHDSIPLTLAWQVCLSRTLDKHPAKRRLTLCTAGGSQQFSAPDWLLRERRLGRRLQPCKRRVLMIG